MGLETLNDISATLRGILEEIKGVRDALGEKIDLSKIDTEEMARTGAILEIIRQEAAAICGGSAGIRNIVSDAGFLLKQQTHSCLNK